MNRFIAAVIPAILVFAGSMACATKTYVQTTTAEIAQQVESMDDAIEEVKEQTRSNQARINVIDSTVQTIRQSAELATKSATEATGVAKMVEGRTKAIEESRSRLVYETVLSEDTVSFGFEESVLSEETQNELKALVEALKNQTEDVLIVLEGHTDSIGPPAINQRIGLDRARAVERYLYEEHHIPPHRMDVISYGEDRPITPNTTREGRSQNRRVVIKVMR